MACAGWPATKRASSRPPRYRSTSDPLNTELSQKDIPMSLPEGSLLEGRVAVVTGGAQGIGLAIAETFVQHGARVVVGDLNPGDTQRILGDAVSRAVRCDVTRATDI